MLPDIKRDENGKFVRKTLTKSKVIRVTGHDVGIKSNGSEWMAYCDDCTMSIELAKTVQIKNIDHYIHEESGCVPVSIHQKVRRA